MSRTPLACLIAITCVATPLHAADGVRIAQRVTTGGTVATAESELTRERMRAEFAAPDGGQQTVIFDGPAERLFLVNDATRAYSEITRADVERLGGQMQAAMRELEAQLQNLPPEMRKQMESMMAGRGGMPAAAGAVAAVEYRQAGTATVGSWTCTRYEGFRDGTRVSEVCTVQPSALGLTEADFAVVEQVADFMQAMMPPGVAEFLSVGRPGDPGYAGIPVRQVSMEGGTETEMVVTEIRRGTFADDRFAVPDGYRREASPFGLPGR